MQSTPLRRRGRTLAGASLFVLGSIASIGALAAAFGPRAVGQEGEDAHAAWVARLTDDGRSTYLASVEGLEAVAGTNCLECHVDVGEEWRHSQHALSWVDEEYQKSLRKVRRKSSCYGCHAPVDLSGTDLTEKPPVRDAQRELGIHCATCHLAADGKTILGPKGLATDAHPSEKSELFDFDETNALCIDCHDTTVGPVIGIAADFRDTDQQELDLSCVGCHMPGLVRPWANAPDGTPGEARRARSHRLETPRDPEFLREAFLLRTRVEDGAVVFVIENQTGHRVPGLKDRKITFELELVDAEGDSAATLEHTIDHRSYLPVEESIELRLDATDARLGAGARVEMKATHTPPSMARGVVFWRKSFELGE